MNKTEITEQQAEELGLLIDELDNCAHALKLPLPPQMHIEQLKLLLPEKVQKFKDLFIAITKENPWE